MMVKYITEHFIGTRISIALEGVPVIISGEVLGAHRENILELKNGDKVVYISGDLIAFVL